MDRSVAYESDEDGNSDVLPTPDEAKLEGFCTG